MRKLIMITALLGSAMLTTCTTEAMYPGMHTYGGAYYPYTYGASTFGGSCYSAAYGASAFGGSYYPHAYGAHFGGYGYAYSHTHHMCMQHGNAFGYDGQVYSQGQQGNSNASAEPASVTSNRRIFNERGFDQHGYNRKGVYRTGGYNGRYDERWKNHREPT